MNRFLSPERITSLIAQLEKESTDFYEDHEKQRIIFKDLIGKELFLRLPVNFYNLRETDKNFHYIILLIQSGSCSLGLFENGKNLDHKVFKSYMVRMKQGVSQVKYLKTKGKSRAGSRVRLRETEDFFDNINGRLQQYFRNYQVEKIAISCSKILIPYLYSSKIECPFSKDDTRLYKIPKHIHLPDYQILLETNKYLLMGELVYEEKQTDFVDWLLDI